MTLTVSAEGVSKTQEAALRENIARSRAAEKGGNVIVAQGELEGEGGAAKQAYKIYFCK